MISLNLYKHFNSSLIDNILRPAGNIYITKGYKIPNKKLNKESLRKVICVF